MTSPEHLPGKTRLAETGRPEAAPGEGPGLPGLGSWRSVYWLVLGSFILYVALLAVLSRAFS
jgi:hypothetical protein